MRINKTAKNLELIWEYLDNASEALYNAKENLALMANIDEKMQEQFLEIDVTLIDCLKEEIEMMIVDKRRENEK